MLFLLFYVYDITEIFILWIFHSRFPGTDKLGLQNGGLLFHPYIFRFMPSKGLECGRPIVLIDFQSSVFRGFQTIPISINHSSKLQVKILFLIVLNLKIKWNRIYWEVTSHQLIIRSKNNLHASYFNLEFYSPYNEKNNKCWSRKMPIGIWMYIDLSATVWG